MPGDFFFYPLDYHAYSIQHGKEATQKLWQENGGTGPYVPGMTAVKAWGLTDRGTYFEGVSEPSKR